MPTGEAGKPPARMSAPAPSPQGGPASGTGRKKMMILSAVALMLSAAGCALAGNAAWLIAARFLGGRGMGVLSTVIPIYISEISPAKRRGTFVSFYQLFIVIGILAAYCADFGMISWTNNQPQPDSVGILIALLVYIAFFAVSLSPLMFVVTAEIYPSAIRGGAQRFPTTTSAFTESPKEPTNIFTSRSTCNMSA